MIVKELQTKFKLPNCIYSYNYREYSIVTTNSSQLELIRQKIKVGERKFNLYIYTDKGIFTLYILYYFMY
jgi:hypothetical protein